MAEQIVSAERVKRARLIRPGGRWAFVFAFDAVAYPKPEVEARFMDDAGLHWQIDRDLHLSKLPDRKEW